MDTPTIVLMSAYYPDMLVEYIRGDDAITETLNDRVGIRETAFVYEFLLAHPNIVFIDHLTSENLINSGETIGITANTISYCLKNSVTYISDNEQWAIITFYEYAGKTTMIITPVNNILLTGQAISYYRKFIIDNLLKELC